MGRNIPLVSLGQLSQACPLPRRTKDQSGSQAQGCICRLSADLHLRSRERRHRHRGERRRQFWFSGEKPTWLPVRGSQKDSALEMPPSSLPATAARRFPHEFLAGTSRGARCLQLAPLELLQRSVAMGQVARQGEVTEPTVTRSPLSQSPLAHQYKSAAGTGDAPERSDPGTAQDGREWGSEEHSHLGPC